MTHDELERLVTRLLEGLCRAMWGFAPRMIPHVVRNLGPGRSVLWFAANMPRLLWTMHVLGPVRTHLAAVTISLHNGCTYCAYGHAFALELVYLRDRGRLFPVSARTLATWQDLPPRELAQRMRRVLQEAGLHAETLWVDRTLLLATGVTRPVDADEARIAHLVRMLGRMNRIAVEAGIEPDEAQNPLNKNTALKLRYTQLRAATG
ncbi:carboxymuconolactone decarboxylase family protein [Pseudonocardia adelaidensis]|uniref:AhpD family alkylhydroperoxidase n=1 Tax=Pseudonocardia adelaidensis TaxID=648754 RepID=A0ABP9NTY7_9PSEU